MYIQQSLKRVKGVSKTAYENDRSCTMTESFCTDVTMTVTVFPVTY